MGPLSFFLEVLRMARADLAARPMRSFLCVLSLSIGIATAVVLVAAGEALRGTVTEILGSMGEGQIVVTPGRTTGLGGQRRAGRPVRLRYDDLQGILPSLPSLEGFAPYYDLHGGGASSWRYSIPYAPARAVAGEYRDVRRMPLTEGRWFAADEEREARWVAVLNEGLRQVIFPGSPAVGQWIEWRGRRMTVVGVVRDEALFPYIFFVPYRTASGMADTRYISGIVARPALGESWTRAVGELRRALAGIGGFDPRDEQALEVEDNREFTGRVQAATAALHGLVITIALVCLLLGGLGVANIMVIAVTERTREIGIRKALGATPRGIFLQILCEAAAIVAAGGIAGISLGAIACGSMGRIAISTTYAAEVTFDPRAAAISLAGLALVAFLAGTIPARRAAALPAAVALRWE